MIGLRRAAARRPWILAAVLYLAVVTILLAPSIRPGRTLVPADILRNISPYAASSSDKSVHNGLPSDAPLQFHPFVVFYAEEIRSGHVPQWNPRILGGVPMSPNGFLPTTYPPSFLARWLDPFDFYNVFVLLHLVVGAMGSYAMARELEVRPAVAWFAGLGVLLSGIWFHWSLHLVHLVGMVWLPFVLAASHRAIRAPSLPAAIGVAATFGMWWLGGNPQYCYFGTLALGAVCFIWLLQQGPHQVRAMARRGGALVAGVAVGVLLAAPTLLPTIDLADDVARVREPVASMAATHLRTIELVELVVPEIGGSPIGNVIYQPGRYGGHQMDTPFVGVVIAVFALAGMASRHRSRLALAAVVIVALLLAFSGWPHRLLHPVLPGYDRFRASSRWLAVLPAVAAPLAALGVAAVLAGERRARVTAAAAAVAAGLVVAALAVSTFADEGAPHRFLSGRLVLAAVPIALCLGACVLTARSRARGGALLLASALLVEVTSQFPRWYPSVEERAAFPRVETVELAEANGGRLLRAGPHVFIPTFASNLPMAYGLDDVQGLAVLFPKRADRYLHLIEDYGTFAAAFNAPPPISDGARLSSKLLDPLDVRTVIVDGELALPEGLEPLSASTPGIYGRPSPGGAILVPDARSSSEEEMWAAVAAPDWDPAATASVVALATRVDGSTGGRVRPGPRSADDERWQVTSAGGGFLRVGAAYHRGWSATVDGEPTEVYLADGMFRGVVVPPGDHVIRFRFRNPAEEKGRALAALGAGLAALALAVGPVSRWRRGASR